MGKKPHNNKRSTLTNGAFTSKCLAFSVTLSTWVALWKAV